MKKKIKQILQKNVKIRHSKNLKGVELLKINVEEVVTFTIRRG
jgi:hypothetical protein